MFLCRARLSVISTPVQSYVRAMCKYIAKNLCRASRTTPNIAAMPIRVKITGPLTTGCSCPHWPPIKWFSIALIGAKALTSPIGDAIHFACRILTAHHHLRKSLVHSPVSTLMEGFQVLAHMTQEIYAHMCTGCHRHRRRCAQIAIRSIRSIAISHYRIRQVLIGQ